MKIEVRRLKISGGALEWSHGMSHDQDYVLIEIDGEDGFREMAVTPFQGGWLLVDAEYVRSGELVAEINTEVWT